MSSQQLDLDTLHHGKAGSCAATGSCARCRRRIVCTLCGTCCADGTRTAAVTAMGGAVTAVLLVAAAISVAGGVAG